jgi:hypothetical protein
MVKRVADLFSQAVVASEAWQSSLLISKNSGLPRRYAPRKDDLFKTKKSAPPQHPI